MGVPKFFRWISERYPKINQRYGSPPNPETAKQYFEQLPDLDAFDKPDPLSTCGLPPEIDRLYLDMNGIIHGCSHNNSNDQQAGGNNLDIAGQEEPAGAGSTGAYKISNDEIFRNICYYLDRLIGDMAQPKQLVYMAIDGVAPRAKMNQQRSRRYRSGQEGEIETNIYDAHALSLKEDEILLQGEEEEEEAFERQLHQRSLEGNESFNYSFDYEEGNTISTSKVRAGDGKKSQTKSSRSKDLLLKSDSHTELEEISPGRFAGKFETHLDEEGDDNTSFHSNEITPGTPFFSEFTKHIEHFVKFKLSTDPKWKDLTIIFSGPNVPGEGEHKIMQFIREQRQRPDYDPNLRHCIMGQDGDLLMLGLCTHEPNLVLLRERVIFSSALQGVKEAKGENMLDSYVHNAHFEYLHMGVLRDYLAYEFETSNVISDSPWDLERTIDDFVFMTFLVGNDFLPHLPAIDIADNAFDLLFWTYKKCRSKWRKEVETDGSAESLPYLTHAGKIVSGKRLEQYLAAVGSHEISYYDKKKQSAETENKRLRKQYKRLGMEDNHLPSDELVASKEASDRAAYRRMLEEMGGSANDPSESNKVVVGTGVGVESFQPVMTGSVKFEPTDDSIDEGLISRMGSILQSSLSNGKDDDVAKYQLASIDDQDLKGRYYYDKFQLTPFDADKHLALRRAYVEGLVWNLSYYYEGCVSWEWYYPYHYGPMLSDLVNLDELLNDIKFDDKGSPLAPFEQLLGCMPPSHAYHLPHPYRWLMTDPESPIIDFYPKTFTVDMNGKRWPWEAVVLLPFIDSTRLLKATSTIDESSLTETERRRNARGNAMVMLRDPSHEEVVPGIGDLPCFSDIHACSAVSVPFEESDWHRDQDSPAVLQPVVKEGTVIPLSGFASLRSAPVQSLWRRKMGLNVFGGRSRYKTASLEISNLMPPLPPVELLGPKLIGTTVYINYPYYIEALVTAVSDKTTTVRGKEEPRKWTEKEKSSWKFLRDGIIRRADVGEGQTGTGGLVLPPEETITLSVRPLEGLLTTSNGTEVKSFAKFAVEIPLISALWSPAQPDPRLSNLPSRLEKNPYEAAVNNISNGAPMHNHSSSSDKGRAKRRKLFPTKKGSPKFSRGTSVGLGRKKISTAQYSTCAFQSSSMVFTNSVVIRPPFGPFLGTSFSSNRSLQACPPKFAQGHPNYFQEKHFVGLQQYPRILPHQHRATRFGVCTLKGRIVASTFIAMSFLFGAAKSGQHTLVQRSRCRTFGFLNDQDHVTDVPAWTEIRGGDFEEREPFGMLPTESASPRPEFAHGTTTLSFSFHGGIVVAVDSRASMGSFVGSKTVQKVLPISSHILGTMAGGAADCQYWIRKVKARALLHELTDKGKRMSVARVSRLLSNYLYSCRGLQLSIGTMIAGWDTNGPQIYYVDNSGVRIQGDLFAVGSGSNFALGILDTQPNRHELSVDDAIALGIKAIRHATFRDAFSGGFINVYLITPEEGWKKVYTEDIARSLETWKVLRSDNRNSSQETI